jgi:lipopolysaccharide transport system permease protein
MSVANSVSSLRGEDVTAETEVNTGIVDPVGDTAVASAPAAAAASQKPYFSIRPTSGWSAINLPELWQFRDLLLSLAARDVKLRYKQTALGIIWVVLQPLLAAGVFSFVFGKVAKLPSDGLPYFLFSFAGLLGWNLFNNTLSKSSICLVGNSQLISKIFFPRLVLPLSTVPSALIDFAVAIVMMAVLLVIYRVPPTPAILLLPVWMALIILLSLGIGLCTAALTVSYRDVQYILPVFLQILLYASPIAYSLSAVPTHLRAWYLINPLSGILEAFRWSLLHTTRPPMGSIIYSSIISLAAVFFGAFSFKRMERQFADVI